MKKINNLDKIYHFLGGFIITLVVGMLTFYWLGMFVGIAVAALKEVYDHLHPEAYTCDGMDFIATVVGVLVAMEI